MKSRLPIFCALLLLAAALLAAAGGLHLSWKPMVTRWPSDREVLRSFAAEVQGELSRLDDLFEADLQEMMQTKATDGEFILKNEMGRLTGAAEWTRLQDSLSTRPQRIRAGAYSNPVPPEVGWARNGKVGLGALEMVTVLGYDSGMKADERPFLLRPSQGWLRSGEGPWALFWLREVLENQRAEALVMTVHAPTVLGVMNRHMQEWAQLHFKPVTALKGLNVLEGPGSVELLVDGEQPLDRSADFVAPMGNGWGRWQLVSWDRLETKPGWDAAVLTVTALVSGVLAITAVMVFVQLRRALRQAEERVTFVNRVSHDLGTPLTNMMLNLDLAKEAVEMDPQDCTERLETVAEEGQRLARLIENVLAFSRSGRGPGPLKLTRCVPKEVVERVLKQFDPALRRRHISTSVEIPTQEEALLDPDALAQILANLISNVEKYAAAGGVLEIKVQLTGGRLILQVGDAGPGIAVADRERIFEPFCRLSHRVNEGASGTGLGLSIARDLARQMGGELRCVDCPRGALFRLDVAAPAVQSLPKREPLKT